MDIIKTMGDFKIPQFTLLTSPEQDEIVRQREAEAEREREAGGTFISIEEMIFQYEGSTDYHAKDDVKALRNILHQLKELGGNYGFNPDYKTNPQRKMRCTMNSSRKRKTDKKAFSSRHNDRNFDSNPEHIAKDKSDKNVIWSWCGTDISFDKGELKCYEETFGAQLEQTNQNYIKSRHKERVVTMDEWRKKAMHALEDCRSYCRTRLQRCKRMDAEKPMVPGV